MICWEKSLRACGLGSSSFTSLQVKQRAYIGAGEGDRLVPGVVGIALCDGYDSMGFEMSKPNLRAGLEADLKK